MAAIRHQESIQRIDQTMRVWDALSLFERRVFRHRMRLPRSLYKYRSIPPEGDAVSRKRLEDLLLDNQLWMATVASFNDPFEGQALCYHPYTGPMLREKMVRKYRELGFTSKDAKAKVKSDEVARPERLIARATQALQTVVARMGMCALSANPSSPLLWAHYAQSHTGLCIQLQPHLDLNALLAYRIEYSATYPVLTDILEPAIGRNVLPMLRKSPDWAYEEEWRLVSQDRTNFYQPFAPEAMTAVILGMRIGEADRAYVLDLMDQRERRYGVRPVIYQAERHPRRYRIRLKRHPYG